MVPSFLQRSTSLACLAVATLASAPASAVESFEFSGAVNETNGLPPYNLSLGDSVSGQFDLIDGTVWVPDGSPPPDSLLVAYSFTFGNSGFVVYPGTDQYF